VDNFLEPGNLQGGFNWYIAANSPAWSSSATAPEARADQSSVRVRWGASDKVLKVEWADQLGEYFSDCDFAPVEDAGHSWPMSAPSSPCGRSQTSSRPSVDCIDR